MFLYALFNINAKNIALLFLEKCLKDITLNENQNTNTKYQNTNQILWG